ncbi:RusA family crossover junction endodeoxyribonuclease [Leptospira levettii]|uniref:RusA family crossover junction endodeoxyribonuclease n=1 Tax=Leptospira levettii TaxID=2023178 RepID=UPI00223E7347|nr:hypothetical protein [Leptospira levettii]MCW7467808.1 RusA family crossover junction endodeoxyribonuclease [Leptospira levettii]MCW7513440.1 RusA family crossover junction endodeoxyribonuclease [Leptospira levettii]
MNNKIILDFIIPKRPVSHQAKDSNHKEEWKQYVYGCAFREWKGIPKPNTFYKFLIVYLCGDLPPDINNVIKPIEDTLIGLVYPDDSKVLDIVGYMRYINQGVTLNNLPEKLQKAIYNGIESVYVQISEIGSLDLEL